MNVLSKGWKAWDAFWFKPSHVWPLDLLRIGIGLALLVEFGQMASDIGLFFGLDGYLGAAARAFREPVWWYQSVFFYFPADFALHAFYALFMLSAAMLALGVLTPVAKITAYVLHLSFLHINAAPFYGADNIMSSLLFFLMFAPVGRCWSVDGWLRKRRDWHPVSPYSVRATMVMRLVQVQLAVMYFFAGFEKLRGDLWWSGDAVWVALNNAEFMNTSEALRNWLAGDYWMINLFTYGTLLVECGYPFLVWRRAWRYWLLIGIVLMHGLVALMMGLYYFSLVMILGNIVFLHRPLPANQDIGCAR